MTETPRKLIESACRIFAQKGYHEATVAEICERAGANAALVNYHFGDKETLYERSWRHAFEQAREEHPIDGRLPPTASAEDRLHAFVRAMLGRVFAAGEAGCFSRIMVREMANPTAALSRIATEALRPQMERLSGILREILGPGAEKRLVRFCMLSVLSQCLMLSFNRPMRRQLLAQNDFTERDLDALARHVCRFSLAGLRATRQEEWGAAP